MVSRCSPYGCQPHFDYSEVEWFAQRHVDVFFSSLGFEPQAAAAVAAHVRQLSEDSCCSRSSSSCRLFGRRSQRLAPLPRLADVPFSFPSWWSHRCRRGGEEEGEGTTHMSAHPHVHPDGACQRTDSWATRGFLFFLLTVTAPVKLLLHIF